MLATFPTGNTHTGHTATELTHPIYVTDGTGGPSTSDKTVAVGEHVEAEAVMSSSSERRRHHVTRGRASLLPPARQRGSSAGVLSWLRTTAHPMVMNSHPVRLGRRRSLRTQMDARLHWWMVTTRRFQVKNEASAAVAAHWGGRPGSVRASRRWLLNDGRPGPLPPRRTGRGATSVAACIKVDARTSSRSFDAARGLPHRRKWGGPGGAATETPGGPTPGRSSVRRHRLELGWLGALGRPGRNVNNPRHHGGGEGC